MKSCKKRVPRRTEGWQMLKRTLSLLLCALMLASFVPAGAAPEVLYNAIITRVFATSMTSVYAKPDKTSKVLDTMKPGTPIQITEVLPNYVGILRGGKTAYVLRKRIDQAVAVDPVKTPRFGTAVNRFYVTIDKETPVKASPDSNAPTLITLQKGAMLGFLDVNDGWAYTIFKRQYGYVDTRLLPELQVVAPSVDYSDAQMPIAVYNSFYKITDDEYNLNRISNLKVGCQRMSITMQPGQTMDFNNDVGPFTRANGYLEAGALSDGEWTLASGGGSCQISSTLYNVVLQLTGLTVLRRAPHGADGASYLPHGVDASSGALNFVFRNDYSFPITIRSHVQDGSLFIAIYRGGSV